MARAALRVPELEWSSGAARGCGEVWSGALRGLCALWLCDALLARRAAGAEASRAEAGALLSLAHVVWWAAAAVGAKKKHVTACEERTTSRMHCHISHPAFFMCSPLF